MEVREVVPCRVRRRLPFYVLFDLDFLFAPDRLDGHFPSLVPWILGFSV